MSALTAHALAIDGTPLAFVRGEAGVGKTRLAAEATRAAVRLGVCAMWGTSHEAEDSTPYGAFVDRYLMSRSASERAVIDAEHPGLAAILPVPGAAPAPPGARRRSGPGCSGQSLPATRCCCPARCRQ
ncbi:hypothetical protein [Streptomyces sp. NPDC048428]|uniref:hypothetical protein n=1 Tax=Streptomyces sp. NPDC048428 TaxID=3154503 RepID=UPI0034445BFB